MNLAPNNLQTSDTSLAHIIIVGDEILLGQIQDTNSALIASKLYEIGISASQIIVVPDDIIHIKRALEAAQKSAGIAIVAGGLGPTIDDVTRPAVAEFFHTPLVFHPELLQRIEHRYSARGIKTPESVKIQAQFPQNAQIIPNDFGTAPGIFFSKNDFLCFVVPGVPREMKSMLENFILPKLLSEKRGKPRMFRILRTAGAGESVLSELLGDWNFPQVKIAYLPKFYGVDLRITTEADSSKLAQQCLTEAEAFLRTRIANYIYGYGTVELAEVIGEILKQNNWKLAIAESCTGGLLSALITDIPGASDYFLRGFITYSNKSKSDLLGVPEELIEKYGAVSFEVARRMAEGTRNWDNADFALSITGIAGPSGGSEQKPVGTTFIGLAHPKGTEVKKFNFLDDRIGNRQRAARAALNMLYQTLKKFL
jgi:nicotinamide-nucleotide amidase